MLLVFSIAYLGGIFTETSVHSWYMGLKKASWNPPSWVFGPAWTLLYIMIAWSGWLIYLRPRSEKRTRALWIYGIQLFLNFLWSFFFFYLQRPILALIDILALLLTIAWTIMIFRPLSRRASLLMFPYFIWVAYAATLNMAICILNRS